MMNLLKKLKSLLYPPDTRRRARMKALYFLLAMFILPIVAYYAFRPAPLKDLSGGTLPMTFTNRSPALQKELLKIHVRGGLPNQLEASFSPDAEDVFKKLDSICRSKAFTDMVKASSGIKVDGYSFNKFVASLKKPDEDRMAKALDNPQLFNEMSSLFDGFSADQSKMIVLHQELSSTSKIRRNLETVYMIRQKRFASLLIEGRTKEAVQELDEIFKVSMVVFPSYIHLAKETVQMTSDTIRGGYLKRGDMEPLLAGMQCKIDSMAKVSDYLFARRAIGMIHFENLRSGKTVLIKSIPGRLVRRAIFSIDFSEMARVVEQARIRLLYSVDSDETFFLNMLDGIEKVKSYQDFVDSMPKPAGRNFLFSATLYASFQSESRMVNELISTMTAIQMALKYELKMPMGPIGTSSLTGKPYEISPAGVVSYGSGTYRTTQALPAKDATPQNSGK